MIMSEKEVVSVVIAVVFNFPNIYYTTKKFNYALD